MATFTLRPTDPPSWPTFVFFQSPLTEKVPKDSEQEDKLAAEMSAVTIDTPVIPRGENFVSLSPAPIGATIPCYKVCLLGDGGVGKTAFTQKIQSGQFEKKYIGTLKEKTLIMVKVKLIFGSKNSYNGRGVGAANFRN